MEATTLFRAIKPFNFKLPKTIQIRCSSISTIHTGESSSLTTIKKKQLKKNAAHVTGTRHRLLCAHGVAGPPIADGKEGKLKRAYDGLLLDAGGTLLQLAKPVEETYLTIGQKYGLQSTAADIKQSFKRAFSASWPEKLRYQGDGKPFWKLVVSEATRCDDANYFEEVYEYYANGDAWNLPEGAYETMLCLKNFGVKLAVVSNFDSRLRKLLKDLNVLDLFDAVIISSEVGYEKPDEKIFIAALDRISVEASKAVHVGDDTKADKGGANAVGIDCWLWGADVKSFEEIKKRVILPQ